MHKPPLLAVRASRALRISRASGAVAALAAASTALMVAACSTGHAVTNAAITNAPITTKGLTTSGAVNPTAASLAAAKLATGMPFGAAVSPGATIPGCVVGTWAEDFTDAGRLAWQVHLPATPGLGYGEAVQPGAIGGLTVFANGDGLYALRLGNGGQVWHRVFGTAKNPALGYVAEVVAWRGSVIALSAATGKTLWQVKTPTLVTAIWPTTAGVAIATGLAGVVLVKDPAARLYLADLKTGKVRWSAAAHTDPYTTPVITATDVITVATTPATGTVVDRAATSGAVKWTAVIGDVYGRYLARPAGPNVLVAFPLANQPSRLLALDVATGATRATKVLPATTTVGAPITVDSGDALLEAETASCAPPVHPGPGAVEHP